MNIYKALYISIIWLLLFLFISLVFLIMGIRLPETEKKWHVQARCLSLLNSIQQSAYGASETLWRDGYYKG